METTQSSGNEKEDTSPKESRSTAINAQKDSKIEEKDEITDEGDQNLLKTREQGTSGILRSDSGTSFRRATVLFSSRQVEILKN